MNLRNILVYLILVYLVHQFLTLLLIWTLLPNLTFYLIARGFHRIFSTGVACQQRTLTPLDTWSCPTLGLLESNTTLREGRGNPFRVSKICNPRRGLPSHGCCKILDTRIRFRSPSLNAVFDYFSHSCLKMCKICLKRTLDATFLDCLALTFCDVIGELLPEWACLTLQGGTIFLLSSKLADIPVSRVRIASALMLRPISPEHVFSPDFRVSNNPRYFCFYL